MTSRVYESGVHGGGAEAGPVRRPQIPICLGVLGCSLTPLLRITSQAVHPARRAVDGREARLQTILNVDMVICVTIAAVSTDQVTCRFQMELLHESRRLPNDVKLLDVAYMVNWDRVRLILRTFRYIYKMFDFCCI